VLTRVIRRKRSENATVARQDNHALNVKRLWALRDEDKPHENTNAPVGPTITTNLTLASLSETDRQNCGSTVRLQTVAISLAFYRASEYVSRTPSFVIHMRIFRQADHICEDTESSRDAFG
jgi:hypothetical protein